MRIFTESFSKIIKQMVEYGHKKITIRLYPEDNYFSLDSEWSLREEITKTPTKKHIK